MSEKTNPLVACTMVLILILLFAFLKSYEVEQPTTIIEGINNSSMITENLHVNIEQEKYCEELGERDVIQYCYERCKRPGIADALSINRTAFDEDNDGVLSPSEHMIMDYTEEKYGSCFNACSKQQYMLRIDCEVLG